jgi:pimeloyl-ACP methyl ester carboxylesterase
MIPRHLLVLLLAIGVIPDGAASQVVPRLVADKEHSVPGTQVGQFESFRIVSSILHETRRIYVSRPSSFSSTAPARRYPVVVVVDGEELAVPVAAVSAHLVRMGQIPEAIIVGIENTNRLRDLTPPGLSVSGSTTHEGGDRFLDFIEQELLPAVDKEFRGAAPRTFVGHSSGGILATYVAATRPEFRAVVAIDAPVSLGDDWLAKKLTARASAPGTAPLRYVSYEAKFGWPEQRWRALVAAAPASWILHREALTRESHESMAMLSSYLGLREVFSDYSMLAAPQQPSTSILPYYTNVSAALGAPVVPPQKLLGQLLEDLLAQGLGAPSREAYEVLVAGYGTPTSDRALTARLGDVERRPAPAETIQGLLSTPFPSPTEAQAYLGDWRGHVWMKPDEPRSDTVSLRIEVVDGKVSGETVHRTASGEAWVQKWEYMRITSTGLTYGFMNQIRPRAVVLFEATLVGDTLSGASRFGGMDFRLPDGSTPPGVHFSFTRVRK